MRKIPFESFSLGHLLVIITLLYGVLIYLLDARYTRMDTRLQASDDRILREQASLTEKTTRLDWYREQGVDFSYARKFNIKPRATPTPIPVNDNVNH